jgi:hypothetical protein
MLPLKLLRESDCLALTRRYSFSMIWQKQRESSLLKNGNRQQLFFGYEYKRPALFYAVLLFPNVILQFWMIAPNSNFINPFTSQLRVVIAR